MSDKLWIMQFKINSELVSSVTVSYK